MKGHHESPYPELSYDARILMMAANVESWRHKED